MAISPSALKTIQVITNDVRKRGIKKFNLKNYLNDSSFGYIVGENEDAIKVIGDNCGETDGSYDLINCTIHSCNIDPINGGQVLTTNDGVLLFDLIMDISSSWEISYVDVSEEEDSLREHWLSGDLQIGVTVAIVPNVNGGNFEHLQEDYAVYMDSHYFNGDYGVIDWSRPMVGEFIH